MMEGQFTEPSGVAVNAQGDIVVADTNNHRIQVRKGTTVEGYRGLILCPMNERILIDFVCRCSTRKDDSSSSLESVERETDSYSIPIGTVHYSFID